MSIITPVYISKSLIKEINKYIPTSRRSKLLSQYIIDGHYSLPKNKEGIREIIEWEKSEVMIIQPFFFAEEAVYQIDNFVKDLEDKIDFYDLTVDMLGRSMILRSIIKDFAEYVRENPIAESKTQYFNLYVAEGTIDRLDLHIDNMERSSTINQFLLEDYKPLKSVKTLKSKVPERRERLAISIETEFSLKRVEEIVESYGDNVTNTHIIRDAIYQLTERLEDSQPKKQELEITLSRTLEEIAKHTNPAEIRELLEKYSPKADKKSR